eukprot:6456747-Lingulodinium_polyedra.AAC.1
MLGTPSCPCAPLLVARMRAFLLGGTLRGKSRSVTHSRWPTCRCGRSRVHLRTAYSGRSRPKARPRGWMPSDARRRARSALPGAGTGGFRAAAAAACTGARRAAAGGTSCLPARSAAARLATRAQKRSGYSASSAVANSWS